MEGMSETYWGENLESVRQKENISGDDQTYVRRERKNVLSQQDVLGREQNLGLVQSDVLWLWRK